MTLIRRFQLFNCFIFIYLFQITIVTADDIYIRTEEEMDILIPRAKNNCDLIIAQTVSQVPDGYCPPIFDGLMCWTSLAPNTRLRLPCPSIQHGFYKKEKAEKKCTQAGNWSHTDFETCIVQTTTETKHYIVIIKIGHFGYAISLVSLLLAIFIMLYFKRLHCQRNTVHVNMFFAFTLRAFIHFIVLTINMKTENVGCKMVSGLQNFAIFASYTWVFMEALYLHNIIFIHVMSEHSASIFVYVTIGWVLPVFVTVIWVVIRIMFDNTACWNITNDHRGVWLLIIYPILTTLCNVAFFVNIIRVLLVKMNAQPNADTNRYRKLAKSTLVLVIVFGIYYIIFIPVNVMHAQKSDSPGTPVEIVKLYYEHLMGSFQGFFVSVLFCFINSEVTTEMRRKFRRGQFGESTMDRSQPHTERKRRENMTSYTRGEESLRLVQEQEGPKCPTVIITPDVTSGGVTATELNINNHKNNIDKTLAMEKREIN